MTDERQQLEQVRCDKCWWFDGQYSQCRVNGPRITSLSNGTWPEVRGDQWCRRFHDKELPLPMAIKDHQINLVEWAKEFLHENGYSVIDENE